MSSMLLLIPVLAAALLDWAAVYKGWRKVEYVAKPATLVLLFAWLLVVSGLQGVLLWFGLGLLFSLAGDVFLMLSDRWFILGLAAFLLAHLMYIAGFNIPLPNVSPVWSLGLAVVLGLSAARLLRRIVDGLAAKGLRRLVGPVLLYGMIITLMLLSAMLTLFREEWKVLPAMLAAMGAALFYISDSFLAWDRFVVPIKNGRLLNMITYHLGQIALIVGVALQLAKL
jgi:uncharacterized membrane protein YhhN